MASIQKISPFLMFDGPVEEVAKFYVSVFPNSEIKSANPMSATIVANGTEILMFNGGSHFKFSPGMSLFVKCSDQTEVDLYWSKFIDGGGREDQCGWLQDKWGVSAAPVAVAAAAPTGGGAGEAATAPEEQTSFDVVLTGAGDKKIQVIKVVREITSLGLKEAKDLVDGAPQPVKQGINKEEADSIKAKLEAEGASVEIK